jgi:hypothetical protein
MTTDSWSRAENVDARVKIGEPDCFPNVNAEFLGKARKLVGKGNIHIAGGVLHKFDHLGCGRVRLDDCPFDKRGVKVAPGLGRFRCNAADHPGILDQFTQNLSWQNALRGIA